MKAIICIGGLTEIKKKKRYGLGLAIAKSTVKRYGGNIEVSYKDGFTIFRVSIPI